MDITYTCPQCHELTHAELSAAVTRIRCTHCSHTTEVPEEAMKFSGEGGTVERCLVCPSHDLFVRKNFPQRLGVLIVVVGFALSCITWQFRWIYATFGVLFATAAIDVLLYLFVGNLLECYRCQAQYRGVTGLDQHAPFNLETHERYRQQRIRLEQSARSSS